MKKYIQKNSIIYTMSNGVSFLLKNGKWYTELRNYEGKFHKWTKIGAVVELNEAFILYKVKY